MSLFEFDHVAARREVSYEDAPTTQPMRLGDAKIRRNPSTDQKKNRRLQTKKQGSVPNGEKTHCPQGHPYNEENTYIRSNGSRQCRPCGREQKAASGQSAQWYVDNRESELERAAQRYASRSDEDRRAYLDRQREYQLRSKYGMTSEEYAALLSEQGGVCAVCRQPETTFVNLPVDHCHKTGKVRGLLCRECNLAAGFLEDDLERVAALYDYLERNQ